METDNNLDIVTSDDAAVYDVNFVRAKEILYDETHIISHSWTPPTVKTSDAHYIHEEKPIEENK